MATTSYITPITDRTAADVETARTNQADLVNKNKGAWNYTDANRVCNNLKYAAEYMYTQGFLSTPYEMEIKTNWKETDIITYEELNTMILSNINNLKTYSRSDLTWYPITSIANMDYMMANWLELDIDALATQEPLAPDTYKLTVEGGSGSGEYEANTVVTISGNQADTGKIFSYWSGDHLENIGSATAMTTTYTMPHQAINLKANYVGVNAHTLTIVTNSGTTTVQLSEGDIYTVEADPAPMGKVFYEWTTSPTGYTDNFYEPAASTTFTMPDEAVTITANYVTVGQKHLVVTNGTGSGYYDYNTTVAIHSNKSSTDTFTQWTGDTQYLTGDVTTEYNAVKIPDVTTINLTAHWTSSSSGGSSSDPLVTNVKVSVVNGVIKSTGETSGTFTEQDSVYITADTAPDGYTFESWSHSGGGKLYNYYSETAYLVVGTTEATLTANYRKLEYHTLTVTTNSGTTTGTYERYQQFSVTAYPLPDNYLFDKWTGDTQTVHHHSSLGPDFETDEPITGTYMGTSDRTITANYRPINAHTLTVKQLSGDVTYTKNELETVSITAEDAPDGQIFTGWSESGPGKISSQAATTTYTFGNGDGTLTPVYKNLRTITVVNGTINGDTSAVLIEGYEYKLVCKSLAVYERFDGWTITGEGSIYNTASTSTKFTVGSSDATIYANITQYPDKTLTIYWRDPDTGADTLVSSNTYTYGTTISPIKAEVAPNKTTFLTWLGDTTILSPSALASTVAINSLTADTTIIATYYYPESPEYYVLTIYNGTPSGTYATGRQISIQPNAPSDGWEFYKWYGDTQYLVDPNVKLAENSVIMPAKAITLYAKFKVEGELALYRVSVVNGTASGTYYTGSEEEGTYTKHEESGVYIDIPEGTEVTLTADDDLVDKIFNYWDGNFTAAGVTDIDKTKTPTIFTMVENDVNVTMVRKDRTKYTVHTTNATGPATAYAGGTYDIVGNLVDTEDYHYDFLKWTCVDANNVNCISAIEDMTQVETKITVTDRDLWATANYRTNYRLTVVGGQDTGDGYYYEGEVVNTVYANTPAESDRLVFDHWADPMGVVANIYDKTPTITMKDTVAILTAVFVSIDATGNSIAVTADDIHDALITREDSYLVNGLYAVGTITFDKDGCIGLVTEVDPDKDDSTNDFKVEKLFYGGNF